MIPYGKQTIDQGDIECVIKVLEENNFSEILKEAVQGARKKSVDLSK